MAKQLPVVSYERRKWFFDERLRQIRNVANPHEFVDLNEFEMEYFRDKLRHGKTYDLGKIKPKRR